MAEQNFEQQVIDRLARIETKIDNGITKKLEDHESRVRDLEQGQSNLKRGQSKIVWITVGAIAAINLLMHFLPFLSGK